VTTAVSDLALLVDDAGELLEGGDYRSSCEDCLQNNCCDEYGTCDSDKHGCVDAALADFGCMLQASASGSVQSPTCVDGGDHAAEFSTCLATKCTDKCGVTVAACQPDPAAPIIVGSQCDDCVSNYCCSKLNTCYGSRPCKLAFDCIRGCPDLTTVFDDKSVADRVVASATLVCSGSVPPEAGAGLIAHLTPSICVNNCIKIFFLEDMQSAQDPPTSPGCRSNELFACAATHCAKDCRHGDPVPDAGVTGDGASE
jgi:hypothetical protein